MLPELPARKCNKGWIIDTGTKQEMNEMAFFCVTIASMVPTHFWHTATLTCTHSPHQVPATYTSVHHACICLLFLSLAYSRMNSCHLLLLPCWFFFFTKHAFDFQQSLDNGSLPESSFLCTWVHSLNFHWQVKWITIIILLQRSVLLGMSLPGVHMFFYLPTLLFLWTNYRPSRLWLGLQTPQMPIRSIGATEAPLNPPHNTTAIVQVHHSSWSISQHSIVLLVALEQGCQT